MSKIVYIYLLKFTDELNINNKCQLKPFLRNKVKAFIQKFQFSCINIKICKSAVGQSNEAYNE